MSVQVRPWPPPIDSTHWSSSGTSGTSGSRRARFRWIGSRVRGDRPDSRGDGSADQAAPVGVLAGAALGDADLVEEAHGVAVELDLVDGLVGADSAQLGRTVGGQHDQRDPRLGGLEHRRVQVGRGGARRRDDRDGLARHLGESEGEEAG